MTIFKELTSLADVKDFAANNPLSFFYISQPNCSVCVSLELPIEQMIKKYPEIKAAYINTTVVPEIAGHFSIFTVPVLLLFVNGKEYIRKARIIHTALLDEEISHIYENRANL